MVRYSSYLRHPISSNLLCRFSMNGLCGPTNLSHYRKILNSRMLPTFAVGESDTSLEDVILYKPEYSRNTQALYLI